MRATPPEQDFSIVIGGPLVMTVLPVAALLLTMVSPEELLGQLVK